MKNGSGATKRASIPSRTRVSKAASISFSVLALRDLYLQSTSTRRFGHLAKRARGDGNILRIDQHGKTNCLWHRFMQQLQTLGPNLSKEKIVAGRISARPSEAGDKA